MDDYYNYVAPDTNPVSDGNKTDVFQAIAGFGWGKKFGNIIDTVKKQGEVLVDVTKRDLSEFVSVVRDDTTITVDTLSHRITDLAVTAQHTLLSHPSASSSTTTMSSSSLSTVTSDAISREAPVAPVVPPDASANESSASAAKETTSGESSTPTGPVPEPSTSTAAAALTSFLKSATSQLPAIALPTSLPSIDLAAIRERLDQPVTFEIPSTIGGVDLIALRDRLDQPVVFSEIKLPGGIDLAHLREEIKQGTKFAEQYLGRFGGEVASVLTNAVRITSPEEQGRGPGSGRNGRGRKIITNRRDAVLAKLRSDPATYLTEPVAAPQEAVPQEAEAEAEAETMTTENSTALFTTFSAGFSVSEYTEDIARLLNEYPEMRKIMERIVPVEVPYNVFWLRYYYRVWQVEQEEERRRQLVQGVAITPQTEEELFNWDMEEEDDPASLSASLSTPLAGSLNASTITGGDSDELVHVSQTPSTEPSLISPVTGSSRAGDTDEENDSWGTETEEARRDEVVQRGSASLEVDKDKDRVKAASGTNPEEGFEIVTEKGRKKAKATAAAGSTSGKPREGGKDRERTAEDDWSDWE